MIDEAPLDPSRGQPGIILKGIVGRGDQGLFRDLLARSQAIGPYREVLEVEPLDSPLIAGFVPRIRWVVARIHP